MQQSAFKKHFTKPKKGSTVDLKWLGVPEKHPIFAGYAVKGLPLLGGLQYPGVTRICSVSGCIRGGAVKAKPWDVNRLSLYDNPGDSWATVPEDECGNYELLAFDIYPEIFRLGSVCKLGVPVVTPCPLSPSAQFLGFDYATYEATSWTSAGVEAYGAGCSPLSCNERANEISVNPYCLLDCFETAMEEAWKTSASGGTLGEPGDYAVYGVYAVPVPD